jgi:hypothetical protein
VPGCGSAENIVMPARAIFSSCCCTMGCCADHLAQLPALLTDSPLVRTLSSKLVQAGASLTKVRRPDSCLCGWVHPCASCAGRLAHYLHRRQLSVSFSVNDGCTLAVRC